jgi:hypothetical protein
MKDLYGYNSLDSDLDRWSFIMELTNLHLCGHCGLFTNTYTRISI